MNPMKVMPNTDRVPEDITYRSSDEILAHPGFAKARKIFIEAILGLYEHEPFLNRLLLEAGRHVIFSVIMCLDANYDEADRTTWSTMSRLKQAMTQFGLASPRRVEAIVARLVQVGYVELVESRLDGRVRLLVPTAKMLAQDQDWLAAHYLPLHVLFPIPGYGPAVNKDPSFQRTQRLVAMNFFGRGAQILSSNPDMMLFLSRDAGVMVLIKLLQRLCADSTGQAGGLSYADIGMRFGVSRPHVRGILQDAARAGLVSLSDRGGKLVQLQPSILRAFDRFIADSMSGHDLLFQIAGGEMACAKRDAS